MEDLSKCPKCGGIADKGIDNCIPQSAYMCSKCCAQEDAKKAATTEKVKTEILHANSESSHHLMAMGWQFLCNGHGDVRLTGGVWLYKGDKVEAQSMQEARWQEIKRRSDGYYAQKHV